MIEREAKGTLITLAKEFPAVIITGPRQSGKTTLVKDTFPNKPYVTFDDIDQLEIAKKDIRYFLDRHKDGLIIDEAQKLPELFPYIKRYADDHKKPGRFIITGSQQFALLSNITESLAGRAGFIQLLPFSIQELKMAGKLPHDINKLLFAGLYPPLYDRKIASGHWHSSYITTYLERDVRSVLNIKELSLFQKFLRMCAARTGQLLNLSNLANDCGVSVHTVRSWLSVLEASYIIFLLQPYFSNFGKRLVKSPKLYFFDPGLAAWLLNIQDTDHLSIHPSRGALFENLIISELIKQRFNQSLSSNVYFWRDNLGDEIDAILDNGAKHTAIEIKSGSTLNQDYFKTLRKWDKISRQKNNSYLIYTGKQRHDTTDAMVLPWNDLSDITKR